MANRGKAVFVRAAVLRNSLLILLLLSSALIGSPLSANAYCVGSDTEWPGYERNYYSIPHEFRRAKYVVDVRAIRETWLGEDGKPKPLERPFQFGSLRPWGFDPYSGVFYAVEVISAYKGNPPDRLTIFSENSTARFWLKVGQSYTLFLSEQNFDSSDPEQPKFGWRLYADNCGNSAWQPYAHQLQRTLEKLSLKKTGVALKRH